MNPGKWKMYPKIMIHFYHLTYEDYLASRDDGFTVLYHRRTDNRQNYDIQYQVQTGQQNGYDKQVLLVKDEDTRTHTVFCLI